MPDRKRTAADWEDIRYFVALSRHGSLSATARALRVNHATVARRIASFERAMGGALFERRPEGYVLNSEGAAVLADAGAMEDAALSLQDRLSDADGRGGLVRLTTVRALADHFLIERLGGLHERHPALDIEILVEARVMSLARHEADLALRLGRPKDSDLLARRLGDVHFAFYASGAYRRTLEAGGPACLVGYDDESDFVAESSWLRECFGEHRFSFRANSNTSQAAAAQAGFGVALLPRYLGGAYPGLEEIDFGPTPPPRDLWLLMRRDIGRRPQVRIVADYIIQLFGEDWVASAR